MTGGFWARPSTLLTVGVAAIVAVIVSAGLAVVPRENAAQGWMADRVAAARVLLFGAKPLASEHVLIVALDQRSLDAPDLRARPRALFTPVFHQVIERALNNGARGIALDFVLAYNAAWLKVDGAAPLEDYDKPFRRTLGRERKTGKIVLATSARSGGPQPAKSFARAAGKNGLGAVEVPVGAGNVVRKVGPVNVHTDNRATPTISGRLRALAGDSTLEPVHITPPAPLDTMPAVSLIDVLDCADTKALERLFEGRLVLVGSTLLGEDRLKMSDRLMPRAQPDPRTGEGCEFPRPVIRTSGQQMLPGVYAHAAAVDGAISGWAPRPSGPGTSIALTLSLGLIAALLALSFTPQAGAALLVSVLCGTFLGAIAALEDGMLLPSAAPSAAALLGFGLTWGVRLSLLDRQANATRRAFGRYLSPVLVNQMIERGEIPELGGQERQVTVMFADLSGFTAAASDMKSKEITEVLNRYLDRIDRLIRDNHGYVDKFIGDAVMAIWNAPAQIEGHALAAVNAAFRINAAVAELAAADRVRKLPEFSIKIGISTGEATVGNVGSTDRLNYTVIGDTVNQAARFESLPGLFKTPIVTGPVTAEHVASQFQLLPIVRIQVKGRSEALRIYAPLARAGGRSLSGFMEEYANGLSAFEQGDFAVADQIWSGLARQVWPGEGIAGAMAEEARYLDGLDLQRPWTGVLEARTK